MRKLLLLLSMLPITSFGGTSPIEYQPSPMSLTDAIGVIDKMIMTQHQDWKPDFLEINDQYILWGEGAVSKGRDGMPITLGSSNSTTHQVGYRLYYDSIGKIDFSYWRRDYYLVSIRNKENKIIRHVLRTKDQEGAKRFVDAMESLVSFYNQNPKVGLATDELRAGEIDESDGHRDIYTELLQLDDLRQRGILTDAEFDAEKKKILAGVH